MSRTVKVIDKDKLEAIINKLESENTYPTLSALFIEVADKYSDLHGVSFSHSCAAQRVKQFGIEVKTHSAKGSHFKGTSGGNIEALKKWRETGEVKQVKPKCDTKPLLAYWAREEGGKYYKLAKKAARGNLKAAIALKCLDCANLQKKEITLCPCTDCPLYPNRPYQV